MSARFTQVGRARALGMYSDWTDRIAAGELPSAEPSRPQGKERNVVVTMWDWADPKVYLHDEIASDKRNPTVNANGPVYGALEESADYLSVVDPKTHTASMIKLTVREPDTPSSVSTPPAGPSPYWGDEAIRNSQTTVHSFAMDKQARVGPQHESASPRRRRGVERNRIIRPQSSSQSIRDSAASRCTTRRPSSSRPSTRASRGSCELRRQRRALVIVRPAGVEGWFDTPIWDKTHDEKQAQGWSAFVLDYNGNGKRDAYTEPNDPADPAKDKRLNVQFYGDSPANDGSVWGLVEGMPGALVRFVPGAHPPETALSEYYEVPWNNPNAKVQGFAPRGMDIDSKNVVWTVLSSGHLASFDRSKCKGPLNGPTAATGQHCPEAVHSHAAGAQLQGSSGERQRRLGVLQFRRSL